MWTSTVTKYLATKIGLEYTFKEVRIVLCVVILAAEAGVML
jgi:hypothetical protein